jgi:hypothetical protein
LQNRHHSNPPYSPPRPRHVIFLSQDSPSSQTNIKLPP